MNNEITARDLATRFFEILDRVKQGEQFAITADEKAVAELVPAKPISSKEDVAEAVERLRDFPRIEGVSGETVLEWIKEGRR